MFRALFDIWDGAFCRVDCFCEECSEVFSEPTGASEVGIFADVPTDLPPLSENKVIISSCVAKVVESI